MEKQYIMNIVKKMICSCITILVINIAGVVSILWRAFFILSLFLLVYRSCKLDCKDLER